MSHTVVKLLANNDGDVINHPKWCLVSHMGGGCNTLCTGEYFGEGESRCKYEIKTVNRGGISCEQCKQLIKEYKKVRL